MNCNYELSWTEFKSKDDLVNIIDEMALAHDMLKHKYNELKREAQQYEKMYKELLGIMWKKEGLI